MNLNDLSKKTGFYPADILLPKNADMRKWSVVACDQYTSEPEYWEETAKIVGDAPSTLNMIIPEAFLENVPDEKIKSIHDTMNGYLPLLGTYENAFVYVKRRIGEKIRRGIVGAVDLEAYDYQVGSTALIRATEGTVLERIPPRMRVRENAPLELPHVMLLIDDCKKTVIEPLEAKISEFEKLYDFELMQGGGHIEGFLVSSGCQNDVLKALADILSGNECSSSGSPMLFAVGDGNHSLATAKACWEKLKESLPPDEIQSHPARFALVEVVNIHDPALEFEPIHRVVFGCDPKALISELESYYENNESGFEAQTFEYYFAENAEDKESYREISGQVTINNPPSAIHAGTLQRFLDYYASRHNVKIDYIHGDDVAKRLGFKKGNIAFILPSMPKDALFKTVLSDGVLPRKTFSMGEAEEKRFYLECKRIK